MSTNSEIKLIGEHLGDGERLRTVCPFCGGGSSGESSLSVLRDGNQVIYNCFRASCDRHGCLGSRRLIYTNNRQKVKSKTCHPYEGEVCNLSTRWKEYLKETLNFGPHEFEMARPLLAPGLNRIAYPIFSPMNLRRGWCLRSYEKHIYPKALTRMDVEEPHLSWYRPEPACPVGIIVEDIPSAVRASRYIPNTIAICGSGISTDYAMELQAFIRKIIWAYDEDATDLAVENYKKFRLLFDESLVLPLQKDLKDMKEEELCGLLKTVI